MTDPSGARTARGGRWARAFESYSIGSFRTHQAAWITSSAAMQMAQIGRPWLAYDISDSALALGLVTAAQGLPQIFSSPFGGLAADRLPKRTVLLISQLVLLVMFGTMAAIVLFGIVEVWMLVALAFVHGVTIPFNNPVRQAYIPILLPRPLLANGVALHASARNFNQVTAPAIVGVLLQIEPFIAFATTAGLHLVSTAFVIRLPQVRPVTKDGTGLKGELLMGASYVVRHPVMRPLLILIFLAMVFAMPYQQLLPVFQKEVLEVGPSRLGFMYTSLGVGAFFSSIFLATFSQMGTKSSLQLAVGLFFGLVLVAFASSEVYLLSVFLLFLTGFATQGFSTLNTTQMMWHSDPAYFGRVTSVQSMIRSISFMAVLVWGALSDMYGVQTVVAIGGGAFAVGVVAIGLSFPVLRKAEGVSTETPSPAEVTPD